MPERKVVKTYVYGPYTEGTVVAHSHGQHSVAKGSRLVVVEFDDRSYTVELEKSNSKPVEPPSSAASMAVGVPLTAPTEETTPKPPKKPTVTKTSK